MMAKKHDRSTIGAVAVMVGGNTCYSPDFTSTHIEMQRFLSLCAWKARACMVLRSAVLNRCIDCSRNRS
jgi:hypothetical protein